MFDLSKFPRICCYCDSQNYEEIDCEWENKIKFKCRNCGKIFMESGKSKRKKTSQTHLDEFVKDKKNE